MGSEAFVASGDKEKAERVSRNERPWAATIEAAESEAFVASGDKEKAERVSRNERPTAATIEAADAARRHETSAFGKAILIGENSINQERLNTHRHFQPGACFFVPFILSLHFRG